MKPSDHRVIGHFKQYSIVLTLQSSHHKQPNVLVVPRMWEPLFSRRGDRFDKRRGLKRY